MNLRTANRRGRRQPWTPRARWRSLIRLMAHAGMATVSLREVFKAGVDPTIRNEHWYQPDLEPLPLPRPLSMTAFYQSPLGRPLEVITESPPCQIMAPRLADETAR